MFDGIISVSTPVHLRAEPRIGFIKQNHPSRNMCSRKLMPDPQVQPPAP